MEICDIGNWCRASRMYGRHPRGKTGQKVVIIEKNKELGLKLLITGNGRCNFTNTASLDVFLKKFGKKGLFYRDVFNKFSNQDLMNFFRSNGLDFIEEEGGRIFPSTGKARSVVDMLYKILKNIKQNNLQLSPEHLQNILRYSNLLHNNQLITAYNVVRHLWFNL